MSLHAQLSPEAKLKLRAQRRNSTVASLAISLLVIVLIGMVLIMFLIQPSFREAPVIVSYSQAAAPDAEDEPRKAVNQMIQRKPSAPSASVAKVIAANSMAPTSVPVPEFDVPDVSMEFGAADDFGLGWSGGSGAESGEAAESVASASLFGAATGPGLVGTFFDLKQTKDAKPTKMEIKGDFRSREEEDPNELYSKTLERAVRRDLASGVFDEFFRAPTQLRTTQFYIPRINASRAPQSFNIGDKVEERRWVILYRGVVTAPEGGTYRFLGRGDDVLIVLVDGKLSIDASHQSPLRGADRRDAFKQGNTPKGWETFEGKWFEVKEGQQLELQVLVGEQPGGGFRTYLLLEKRGAGHGEDSEGHPTFPLFKMAPSSQPKTGRFVPELAPDTSWSVWKSAS